MRSLMLALLFAFLAQVSWVTPARISKAGKALEHRRRHEAPPPIRRRHHQLAPYPRSQVRHGHGPYAGKKNPVPMRQATKVAFSNKTFVDTLAVAMKDRDARFHAETAKGQAGQELSLGETSRPAPKTLETPSSKAQLDERMLESPHDEASSPRRRRLATDAFVDDLNVALEDGDARMHAVTEGAQPDEHLSLVATSHLAPTTPEKPPSKAHLNDLVLELPYDLDDMILELPYKRPSDVQRRRTSELVRFRTETERAQPEQNLSLGTHNAAPPIPSPWEPPILVRSPSEAQLGDLMPVPQNEEAAFRAFMVKAQASMREAGVELTLEEAMRAWLAAGLVARQRVIASGGRAEDHGHLQRFWAQDGPLGDENSECSRSCSLGSNFCAQCVLPDPHHVFGDVDNIEIPIPGPSLTGKISCWACSEILKVATRHAEIAKENKTDEQRARSKSVYDNLMLAYAR